MAPAPGRRAPSLKRAPPARRPGRRDRLSRQWSRLAARLRRARHVALLLDFDGTLSPICRRPEEVYVDESIRLVLRRLVRHRGVSVAVISGRRRADLRQRLGVQGIRYLGLHGWEQGPRRGLEPAERRALLGARGAVAQRLAGLAGVWIEDKGFAFTVHYREAPGSVARRARPLLLGALQPFASRLQVLDGRKVWEVLPRGVRGKGTAVRALLQELPAGALSVYVGDDAADEPAFAALKGGVTIRVGLQRRTLAGYRVRDPRQVCRFLERLEAALS